MALALRETAELVAQTRELQKALGLKNKAQTIVTAIETLHRMVCPKSPEDVVDTGPTSAVRTMFRQAAILRSEGLSKEEREALAAELGDSLYILLRYGLRGATTGPFDSAWLNAWYLTLVKKNNGLPTEELRSWKPYDFSTVLLVSVPRGDKRVAAICTELPAMGYLFQDVVGEDALSDLFMGLFLRHLEERTGVLRCELSHLGALPDLITDEKFRDECVRVYRWWRDHGMSMIDDADKRRQIEEHHLLNIKRAREFLEKHDAVEIINKATELADVLRTLPPHMPADIRKKLKTPATTR